jgi:hypothetical protein
MCPTLGICSYQQFSRQRSWCEALPSSEEIAEKRTMVKQGHGQKPALTQAYAQFLLGAFEA